MRSQDTPEPALRSSPVESLSGSNSQGSRILQVHPEEFLPSPRPLLLAGGWVALLTLTGALTASWFLPYKAKVKAPAVVRPSEAAVEEKFVLQAWVPNASINQVQAGQEVQVRLAACPYPDYGILRGSVVAIAPDVVPPGRVIPLGLNEEYAPAGSYEVTLQPRRNHLQNRGERCPLRAGMEGRADIQIGQETVLSFLLRQLR